jgi:hypothetical protein
MRARLTQLEAVLLVVGCRPGWPAQGRDPRPGSPPRIDRGPNHQSRPGAPGVDGRESRVRLAKNQDQPAHGQRPQTVSSPMIAAHLDAHVGPSPELLLFTNTAGRPIRATVWAKASGDARAENGLHTPPLHDLRHLGLEHSRPRPARPSKRPWSVSVTARLTLPCATNTSPANAPLRSPAALMIC